MGDQYLPLLIHYYVLSLDIAVHIIKLAALCKNQTKKLTEPVTVTHYSIMKDYLKNT